MSCYQHVFALATALATLPVSLVSAEEGTEYIALNEDLSIDPTSILVNDLGVEFTLQLNGQDGAAFCAAIDVNGQAKPDPFGSNEIRMSNGRSASVVKRIGKRRIVAITPSDFPTDNELLQTTYYDQGTLRSYECAVDQENLWVQDCTPMSAPQWSEKDIIGAMKYYVDSICVPFYKHVPIVMKHFGTNWNPQAQTELERDTIVLLKKAGIHARFESRFSNN